MLHFFLSYEKISHLHIVASSHVAIKYLIFIFHLYFIYLNFEKKRKLKIYFPSGLIVTCLTGVLHFTCCNFEGILAFGLAIGEIEFTSVFFKKKKKSKGIQ